MAFKEYIDKDTKKAVGVILASVLIFNSLPRIGFIGKYFDQYPLATLIIGVAIIFFIFKDK